MPRKGITAYDLLISCPGDVIEYTDTIKECIDSFNRYIGVLNNAEIAFKHWSTDSYSQSGDKPQELLNKQFVRDCDAAIAVFWTRFGTPTDKYGSGTEEEIEEMLSANKQVFMYFLDTPIEPSRIVHEQYNKVLEFREKYKDKGIYFTVKSIDEFKTIFSNHLIMHFLPLISGTSSFSSDSKIPVLDIKCISKGDICNSYSLCQTNLCESALVKEKHKKIIESINKLNQDFLPKRENKSLPTDKPLTESLKLPTVKANILNTPNFEKLLGTSTGLAADFNKDRIPLILEFASANNITISEDFWNVGNLTKSSFSTIALYGNQTSYYGTDNEKERYNELNNLYWSIKEYNEYCTFFTSIDSLKLAELAITNIGTSFDEDICIKLIFPKNCLLNIDAIPTPEINVIEHLSDLDFVDAILKIKESDKIDSYAYYPISPATYSNMIPLNPFNTKSASEEYKENKNKYYNTLQHVFCYKTFTTQANDILVFNIQYLKHNTSMAFPSVLLFNNKPEYINYEITSKLIPDVIKGKIVFED